MTSSMRLLECGLVVPYDESDLFMSNQEENEQWLEAQELVDARAKVAGALSDYLAEPGQPWRFEKLRDAFVALDKLEMRKHA